MWILRVLKMGVRDRGDVSLLERFNLFNQLVTLLLSTTHAPDSDLHSAVLHVLLAVVRALGDSAFEHLVLKRGLLFPLSRLARAYGSSAPLPLSESRSTAPDRTPERSLLARLLLRLLLAERQRLKRASEKPAPLLLYRQCHELFGVLAACDTQDEQTGDSDGVSLPPSADSALRRRTARKLIKSAVARCHQVFPPPPLPTPTPPLLSSANGNETSENLVTDQSDQQSSKRQLTAST